MLRAMVAGGHRVLAIGPEDDPAVRAELGAQRVEFTSVPLQRTGLNPLQDARTVLALTRVVRDFRPDAILMAAVKPIAYGSIAARVAGVPIRAAMITGVGTALGGGSGARARLVAAVVRRLYRVGLEGIDTVLFQNAEDEDLFRRLGLINDRHRLVRIPGSGVDIEYYRPEPMAPTPPVVFLMMSRLLRDKGVIEYLEAARRVKREVPGVRMQLLGRLDENPSGITERDLREIIAEGAVEYLGVAADVRPHLAGAHVCVLPSYREGTPKSLLEAMAMGRPLLATDVPGCRETVAPGRNGELVAVRDVDALVEAIKRMVALGSDRLAAMGRESRAMAEERFDVRDVNRLILGSMGLD